MWVLTGPGQDPTIEVCVVGIGSHCGIIGKDALHIFGIFLVINSVNDSRTIEWLNTRITYFARRGGVACFPSF